MHISARSTRTASWIALPLAVVASGAVIATASYAAFTASTDNAANAWRTGGITLTDDDQDAAMFDVADLMPGDRGEHCITVTAASSAPTTVQLFTTDTTDDDQLAQHLGMTVERGTLGTAGDCSTFTAEDTVHQGTLAELATATSFGSGLGSWETGTGATTTYRFSYDLAADTPNTAQQSAVGTTFVWEAQAD